MKKKSNLWKYIAAAVGGVAVIAIVVFGATGDYFQGRFFTIKSPQQITDLKTVAPVPVESVEVEKLSPDLNLPDEILKRCYTECELTTKHNALVTEVRNINFTATINALESRIRTLENTLANGNFTSQINDLDNRVNGLQSLISMVQTQIGGFQYTSTINGIWSGIFSIGNALTNHTSAHNAGGYPPIYGVDY